MKPALLLVLLGAAAQPTSAADEVPFAADRFVHLPADQAALLRQFHESYGALKRFYQNATITARQYEYRLPRNADGLPSAAPPVDVELAHIEAWRYRARDGKYFRLDGESIDLADQASLLDSSTGVIGPNESFLLGFDRRAGKHFLKAHGNDRDEYLSLMYSYLFPVAPFAFGGQLLEHVVFAPGKDAVVTSATADDEHGATVVVVTTTAVGTSTVTLQLLRDQHWSVRRIESESRGATNSQDVRSRVVQECAYEGAIQGFPLLKRVTYETYSGYVQDPELLLRQRRRIEVEEVVPGPVDESVFDVGQLIPKFERVGDRRSPTLARWLLLINGLILVSIGVYLSRPFRSRRGNRPAGE